MALRIYNVSVIITNLKGLTNSVAVHCKLEPLETLTSKSIR